MNGRETGPISLVSLPIESITSLQGIMFDLDRELFRADSPVPIAICSPKEFTVETLGPMLDRHPALREAEVRDTGRNVHAILWLDGPISFESAGERQRWEGIVQVVQAALPIDPHQPGLSALTRPVGSVNSKTGRKVKVLRRGTPVPVGKVLGLYEEMCRAPFRTLMRILLGAERITPCPVCTTEGSSLAALDRIGRCYACGKVEIHRLYDLFLAPRVPKCKEVGDGKR